MTEKNNTAPGPAEARPQAPVSYLNSRGLSDFKAMLPENWGLAVTLLLIPAASGLVFLTLALLYAAIWFCQNPVG